jgi:hypothetical protein
MARVSRILTFWNHPHHLDHARACAWASREAGRLTARPGIEGGELFRIVPASQRWSPPADWMLELRLADGARGHEALEGEHGRAWLSELRLLGASPAAGLLHGVADLTPPGR